MQKRMGEARVRDAREEDLQDIATIWNHYILTTASNWRHRAWEPEALLSWFARHGTPESPVLVVEQDGRVLGFAALSSFRPGQGYRFVAENSVYLLPEAQGHGLGTSLMHALMQRGRQGGLKHLVAVIDSGNGGSIAFHEKLGFIRAGVLQDIGEKYGKARSCVLMQRSLV